MPWFKVDDGFHGHPKVVELSLAAVGLWTLAGSWCAKYLTDGMVPTKTVTRLGGDASEAGELVAAELWLKAAGGYQFKDWHHYQPLKEAVEAERAAAQERMRKARAAKKGVQANNERTTADSSPEVPVTPSQSQSHPSTSSSTKKRERATRLEPDWLPSAESVAKAKTDAPHVDHKAEHASFVDYWVAVPGAKGLKLDWEATWRNWMRRKEADHKSRGSAKVTPEERARQTLALANNFKEIE
jgi:hypothetical protein